MCILLKLHYAKFDVSGLFCSKVIEEKPLGVGSTPPLVKEGLKCRYLFLIIKPCLFCLLFYFQENVKKLLRNFEYSKSQKAEKLSVLRPDLSFL